MRALPVIAAFGALLFACAPSPSRDPHDARVPWLAPAECRPNLTARWVSETSLVVDVTPVAPMAYFVESDAAVVGGKVVAIFGEAGIPSWRVEPELGATAVKVTLDVVCHERTSKFLVRLDLRALSSTLRSCGIAA